MTLLSIIHSYGGPGSQKVRESFSIGWQTYMASTHKVAYAFVDGRGTAARGDDFRFLLYRKVGTIEIEDQILAGE